MKKYYIATSILLVLIIVSSLIASCAEGEVTKTITVAGSETTVTITTTGQKTTVTGPPLTKTLTVQPPGEPPITITPTFTVPIPPDIPHPFIYEDLDDPLTAGLFTMGGVAVCFVCHGQVENHNLWAFDPYVCLDCHSKQTNPILPFSFDEEWWILGE